eukprot:2294359-Prymnesium_polylepis.1
MASTRSLASAPPRVRVAGPQMRVGASLRNHFRYTVKAEANASLGRGVGGVGVGMLRVDCEAPCDKLEVSRDPHTIDMQFNGFDELSADRAGSR